MTTLAAPTPKYPSFKKHYTFGNRLPGAQHSSLKAAAEREEETHGLLLGPELAFEIAKRSSNSCAHWKSISTCATCPGSSHHKGSSVISLLGGALGYFAGNDGDEPSSSFFPLRIERGLSECPKFWVKLKPDHSRRRRMAVASCKAIPLEGPWLSPTQMRHSSWKRYQEGNPVSWFTFLLCTHSPCN